jgi:hypothetical protein
MDSGEQAKRNIPADIRRAVRQRCGFGCVICGVPLFEYEHKLGWAAIQRHAADEITLLCDRHHREKTAGLLPQADVESADVDPFNRRAGASAPYALHYAGSECQVQVGGNLVVASTSGDVVAIMIDANPLIGFRFEDGHYLLNCVLFGACNEPLVRIKDSELVYSTEPWDIEWIGTRLTIPAAARKIFVEIRFEPPNLVVFERGRILFNGVELFLRPAYLLVVNNTTLMRGCSAQGCAVALNIGEDPVGYPSAFRIAGVPRYEVDRQAALRWAREQVGSLAEDLE